MGDNLALALFFAVIIGATSGAISTKGIANLAQSNFERNNHNENPFN